MRYSLSIITFLFIFWSLLASSLFSETQLSSEPKQKFINTELTLLAPESLYASLFSDIASMNSWSTITLGLLEEIAELKSPQTVSIFQITLSADAKPIIEEISEPPLPPEIAEEYRSTFLAITPPELKFGKLAFRISVRPRSVSNKVLQDLHQSLLPYLASDIENFRSLSLGEKIAKLSIWSRDEAIPALIAYSKLQHPKLQGINSLLSFFEKHDDSNIIPIQDFTESNPLFWRAVFEMPADQPLASTFELLAHISNRNFAYAKRLLNVTLPFSSVQKPSGFYLDQVATLMQILQEDIQTSLNEVRSLLRAKKFDEAILLCEDILTAMPGHPIFLHEYIQANLAKRQDEGEDVSLKDFMSRDLLQEIYNKDPFFIGSDVLRSARDAYNNIQRNRINALFKDSKNYQANLPELSQTALNLNAWHFAAHLFHRSLYYNETDEAGKNQIIGYFLYALEQNKISDFKSNFPGDHNSTFTKIDKELNSRFKASDVYRGFKSLENQKQN